jgi:glycosyltransferase involved in cell wall biosynthesis
VRRRVCVVTASEWTPRTIMLEPIRGLTREYDVVLVSSFTQPEFWDSVHPSPRCITLRIERPISPVADLTALIRLYGILRRGRFDAVHSVNPKAGLLTAIAGALARVPVRIHTFSGQVWATRRGLARAALKAFDRIIVGLDTHILVDGPSQIEFLRREGVLPPERGWVAGDGSIGGVNVNRFRPDAESRAAIRRTLGVAADGVLFVFVGRMNRDKGVLPMAHAFAAVAGGDPRAYLLLIGEDEQNVLPEMLAAMDGVRDKVRAIAHTSEPERYLAAADVLLQPSFREGFSNIVVEAGAVGLPAIASRIYGLIDPVGDGIGGILVPPGDTDELAGAMRALLDDPILRRRLGTQARERVIRKFDSRIVVGAILGFYRRALSET